MSPDPSGARAVRRFARHERRPDRGGCARRRRCPDNCRPRLRVPATVARSAHVLSHAAAPHRQPEPAYGQRGLSGDRFGAAVAIVDGQVLIGAPGTHAGAQDTGVAYLVDPSPRAITRIDNPAQGAFDRFGSSVASGPSGPIIGAPGPNRVYVYSGDGGTTSLAVRNALGCHGGCRHLRAALRRRQRRRRRAVRRRKQHRHRRLPQRLHAAAVLRHRPARRRSVQRLRPLHRRQRRRQHRPVRERGQWPVLHLGLELRRRQCLPALRGLLALPLGLLRPGIDVHPQLAAVPGQDLLRRGRVRVQASSRAATSPRLPNRRSPTKAMSNALRPGMRSYPAAQNGGSHGQPHGYRAHANQVRPQGPEERDARDAQRVQERRHLEAVPRRSSCRTSGGSGSRSRPVRSSASASRRAEPRAEHPSREPLTPDGGAPSVVERAVAIGTLAGDETAEGDHDGRLA